MARASNGDVEIEFETIGERDGVPMLLIAGASDQLIHWPDRFCERLAVGGCLVVRYDSRDVGLSSWVSEPYGIDDTAADAVAVLDAARLGRAIVVGNSQGGMVAQRLAIRHAQCVSALVLMSTIGDRREWAEAPEEVAAFVASGPSGCEAYADWFAGSMRGPETEDAMRDLGARSYDRGLNPAGVLRHVRSWSGTSWHNEIGSIAARTLVLHGERDDLIPARFAGEPAASIPDGELEILPGRGHDLPWGVEDEVADRIHEFVARPTH